MGRRTHRMKFAQERRWRSSQNVDGAHEHDRIRRGRWQQNRHIRGFAASSALIPMAMSTTALASCLAHSDVGRRARPMRALLRIFADLMAAQCLCCCFRPKWLPRASGRLWVSSAFRLGRCCGDGARSTSTSDGLKQERSFQAGPFQFDIVGGPFIPSCLV